MTDVDLEHLITQASRLVRGTVLQVLIELESLIDYYLARHITEEPDKINELVSLILAPRVSVESKRQVFCFLVNKLNPEFKKAYPNHNAELKDIIEKRVIYAHYPVEFSEQAQAKYKNETTITFVKFKNLKSGELVERIYVNDKDMQKLVEEDIGKYILEIKKLLKLI